MCKFEYRVYKCCFHLGIELSNFCPKVLFGAGMTGVLKPCEEEKYRSHVLATPSGLSNITDFEKFPWTEIKDICEKCQQEQQNSGPAHDSHGQQGRRTANPLHPPQMQPHNRLTIDHLRPDVNVLLQSRPYIYRPTLKTNVLELFSIQSEVSEEERRTMTVEHICFPPMLKMFDIKNYDKQWWSEHKFDDFRNCIDDGGGYVGCIEFGDDYYGGAKLCGHPDAYLAANGGLTASNKLWIKNMLNQVVEREVETLANIWETHFKERGMPEELFRDHAKRSEVIPFSGKN